MMLHIPDILTQQQVFDIRQKLDHSLAWMDGKKSAGTQAQSIKNNLQMDIHSEDYQQIAPFILQALQKQPMVHSAALPLHILTPMINCYQNNGHYGNHVDSAIQYSSRIGQNVRTDVSMTIFLSNPNEYQGGELIVEDNYGIHEVKLNAGDAILYPATSLHRVEPVTQGKRIAAFTWVQSMVKDDWQRCMLYDLDMTILKLRQQLGDSDEIIHLTSHYHNLLRQWANV